MSSIEKQISEARRRADARAIREKALELESIIVAAVRQIEHDALAKFDNIERKIGADLDEEILTIQQGPKRSYALFLPGNATTVETILKALPNDISSRLASGLSKKTPHEPLELGSSTNPNSANISSSNSRATMAKATDENLETIESISESETLYKYLWIFLMGEKCPRSWLTFHQLIKLFLGVIPRLQLM